MVVFTCGLDDHLLRSLLFALSRLMTKLGREPRYKDDAALNNWALHMRVARQGLETGVQVGTNMVTPANVARLTAAGFNWTSHSERWARERGRGD